MKQETQIHEVINDYTDDDNYTHIDLYESPDENIGGQTVAIVCRDTSKVYFIDNRYRNNEIVVESIKEILNEIAVSKPNP